MSREAIVISDATLTLGATGSEVDFSCQVNSAALVPSGNTVDVPATFCVTTSQTASGSSWVLQATILQDWGAVDSVSQYLFDHDAERMAFHMDGIAVTGATVEVDGELTVLAAQHGGEAGVVLTADVAMPILGKPTIVATPPTGTTARAADTELVNA